MAATNTSYLTLQQYLELEEKAEYKSEYYQGRMWPLGGTPFGMAGGRSAHSIITMNLGGELRSALKPRCVICSSDMSISTGPDGLYTYPDISVVCGTPEFLNNDRTLLNPIIVIEVLSKTTEAHDRGFKFTQYQQIPSLQEYVLVSQTEPSVEIFRRGPNGAWGLKTYTALDTTAQFESVGCGVPMREIYLCVEFAGAR